MSIEVETAALRTALTAAGRERDYWQARAAELRFQLNKALEKPTALNGRLQDSLRLRWYVHQRGLTIQSTRSGKWHWYLPEGRGIPLLTTLGEFNTYRECLDAARKASNTPT